MHLAVWCVVLLLLTFEVRDGDGKVPAKDVTSEKENQRSHIPRHHRSSESQSRRNMRAERGRYRSVMAVGVGCAVAGGWICLATIVYVVRYIRAKRKAAAQVSSDDDLL